MGRVVRGLVVALLLSALSGCFIVGGMVGATFDNVHNASPDARAKKQRTTSGATIGLVVGLVVDLALVIAVVSYAEGNQGQ